MIVYRAAPGGNFAFRLPIFATYEDSPGIVPSVVNDCLAGGYGMLVGTPVPGCPVILRRKITLLQGNYRYFPSENPKMLHIFGGHPRTGVPTVLSVGCAMPIPICRLDDDVFLYFGNEQTF